MLFQEAEKFLSANRLAPYKLAAGNVEQSSLNLYLDNLKVAQSFYAPLSFLEVCLRNAVHDAVAAKLRSSNWLLEQQTGFMINQQLTFFDRRRNEQVENRKILSMVKTARLEFKEKHRYEPPNGSALIADLSFGFWTTLFTKTYFELLNRAPLNAFAHRPRGTGRDVVYDKLQSVRLFRNRVYHYEPLCFQPRTRQVLCFSQLYSIHDTICELLGWLDPNLPQWLAEIDRVPETLQKLKKKYPAAI